MSRTIVGPFNRVEGDLEVALDIDDGRIASAEVTTTLYRGFEQLLDGRVPLDALVIAPRICGICSVSQSIAAATALRELTGGRAADNGVLATNIAHAAENVADHLTHFYLFFMPDFARAEYAGRRWFEATAKRFKAVTGEAAREVLAGAPPSARDDGHPRRQMAAFSRLSAGRNDARGRHGRAGATAEPGRGVPVLSRRRAVRRAARSRSSRSKASPNSTPSPRGPAGRATSRRSCAIAADLRLDEVGRGPGPFMSFGAYHGPDGPLFARGLREGDEVLPIDAAAIGEDVAHAWMREAARAPLRIRNRSRRAEGGRLFLGESAALSRRRGGGRRDRAPGRRRASPDSRPLAARRREHRARARHRARDRNRRPDARAGRMAARAAAERRLLPSVGDCRRTGAPPGSSRPRAARSATGWSRAPAKSPAIRSSRRPPGTFRRATARAAPARWRARSPASKSARSALVRRSSSTSCARSIRAWCAPRIDIVFGTSEAVPFRRKRKRLRVLRGARPDGKTGPAFPRRARARGSPSPGRPVSRSGDRPAG